MCLLFSAMVLESASLFSKIYTSDVSPFHMFAFSPCNSYLGDASVGGSLSEVEFLIPSIMVIVLYYFQWCLLPFVFSVLLLGTETYILISK